MNRYNSLLFKYLNSKAFLYISIITFGLLTGGLFFSSHPVETGNQIKDDQPVKEALWFTSPVIPENLDFAGETVPLSNFDVRESLERELLINANFHSQTLLYLKKSKRYFSVIEPILKKNNIPDDFKYLALAESGFQDKVVSQAGAVGIWQFMKTAALENGLEINDEIDERYHLEKATEAACKFLTRSFTVYKNWTMVAASYNAGVSGVNKQSEVQDSKNYYDLLLNEETARYLYRILSLKLVMSEPLKYGFRVTDEEIYQVIPCHELKVNESVQSFAEYAKANGINYKLLKLFNPWLRKPNLKNTLKKTYFIKIPEIGNIRKFVTADENKMQK